jgi:voltage-gated potassium channel
VVDSPLRGFRIAKLVMGAVLISALGVVGTNLFWFGLGVVLTAAVVTGDVVENYVGSTSVLVAAGCVRALALMYMAGIILRETLRERNVTFDTIAGAASVYLLLGFVGANLFAVLERMEPGSFTTPPHWMLTHPNSSAPFIYFSFVTLATLGYGDIVPARPAAAALTLVEALVGQLYMAILIAWLVGLYAAQPRA